MKRVLIFTRAYDEYALKAVKLNAMDYLLKSMDVDDLEVVISKFKMRLPKPENTLQLDFKQIKKMFQNPFGKNFKTRFTVKIGQDLKVISVDEIECFFSENKETYTRTFDNRNYLIEFNLEVLEQELETKNFIESAENSLFR